MDPLFFRVEHDLLRSEAFQSLGGSAIKVYLVIGLHADFGTGWAYPSIRTIARIAGLSRQTVLDAIADLTRNGLLASRKARGKSTAYKIIRQEPEPPPPPKAARANQNPAARGPKSCKVRPETGPKSFKVEGPAGPESYKALAQFFGPAGPANGPKRDPGTREGDNTSIPIPGTPFRLTAEGRLQVAVDLQGLLTEQGVPRQLAERLASLKSPETVAKVLLNALYLQSQGKLQNGPGYIRAGIEDDYDLLPQVANRLESRRRELEERLRTVAARRERMRQEEAQSDEEAAIRMVIESIRPDELQRLVDQAIAALPGPLVRRNPTLSNPFVRSKVYELAGGEPLG